ncbi:hypothetical protein AAC387_Pa08g2344 [Persea americana]
MSVQFMKRKPMKSGKVPPLVTVQIRSPTGSCGQENFFLKGTPFILKCSACSVETYYVFILEFNSLEAMFFNQKRLAGKDYMISYYFNANKSRQPDYMIS